MRFTVPGTLPTMNEIIKVSKSHPMAYANMKKDYTALIMMQSKKLPEVGKADFEITWYCKDKRKDKDNIMSGQKFIFDGLVKAGVLKGDGWSQIGDVAHYFEIDKQNPRVEINIREYLEAS
ncbi:Holliday junction resolvase RusA-like endonuclease [Virgibacillus natechei]|uniref:Holliday junction resolvase RusA-like endonuclease n=1 Tax=Virgibacillus natechei TaxID=1216297 RepID=A0ABS4IMS5_9BACI|nr:RusA family crossover junction endodeoxyribonuclease [Virgibacillus natechei]MBP1971601.1 Holliday junction resolvase RusA-like endonuclease [Virgibacillus natechei]UZD13068.1 RusA family crossover junction endodeoxyribonuclease [Virgibacillus natechei]